jgi:hypothetical protein
MQYISQNDSSIDVQGIQTGNPENSWRPRCSTSWGQRPLSLEMAAAEGGDEEAVNAMKRL